MDLRNVKNGYGTSVTALSGCASAVRKARAEDKKARTGASLLPSVGHEIEPSTFFILTSTCVLKMENLLCSGSTS